jgi:retron-type reverse transcriptase
MTTELMEPLAARDNLLSAWRAVRGNVPRYRRMTSAGPDGVTLAEFQHDLNAQLETLHELLLHDRYEPAEPKLIRLPKPSGGERVIGILNVRDRVAQRAAVQVLAPVWEPEFLDCNFGFRPGRGTPTALAYIQSLRTQNAWVVEGDIENCFGALNHELMLKRVQGRLQDRRVLRLVERWLDCGALSAGLPEDEPEPAEVDRWQRVAEKAKHGASLVMEAVLPGSTGPGVAGWGAARADDNDVPSMDYDAMMQAEMTRRWIGAALAAGVGWLRPNIGRAMYQTSQFFNTPAGRRMLRNGSWMVAGLAGAAAVGAVSALAMRRYAGPAPTGVVQGSPLSPLLANVYLNPFDHWMRKRGHELVRYADDFVVLAPDQAHAESGFNDSLAALHKLRLKVNRQKMRIVPPGERWEFLGESFK